jgi:hypothetical protein
MNNAEWMVQNGYKFSELRWSFPKPGICSFYLNDKNVGKVSSLSIFEAIKTWLDAEHVEPILDDEEREYLSAVIKPFRDRVMFIEKMYKDHLLGDQDCYLFIRFNDGSYDMNFPFFDESYMYKGLEINRTYTLEELGL